MLKQTIVTLFGFLTIASAISATFEDSVFYFNPGNLISYELFQTRGGIVARDYNQTTMLDTYMLINLQTKNVSVILSDIVGACSGNYPTNWDRLYYHVSTSTLLYYCVTNNSLLVIDQNTYTVDLAIPTNVSATFDEVKFVPQGNTITILGLIGVSVNPQPSQLITVDLQSQAITRNVVFEYDLDSNEIVVGYTVSPKGVFYVLTATPSETFSYQVTLYSMMLIGNSYALYNMTSLNFENLFYPFWAQLDNVGGLLIISSHTSLYVVSAQGNVIGTVENLATKAPPSGSIFGFLEHVAVAIEYGSSDFYALLTNSSVLKFSVDNGGYNTEIFASNVQDMQYVSSNQNNNSLLFTTNTVFPLFNITDLQTSRTIYSTIAGNATFFTSDTKYAGVVATSDSNMLYIFDRQTNLLIYQDQIPQFYFFDENSHLFSYIEYTNASQSQCQMVQLDLQTANSYVPFTLDTSYGTMCQYYRFANVTNDYDTPQFLLLLLDNLLIVSENFGSVLFSEYTVESLDAPFIDYDTLTLVDVNQQDTYYGLVLDVWTYYNPSNQEFMLQNSTKISDVADSKYKILPGQLLVLGSDQFELLDFVTFNKTIVDYQLIDAISFFQDKTGALYIVLGYDENLKTFNVYYDGKVSQLAGVTANTNTVSAAGRCRYSVMDELNNDISLVSFYNVCSEQNALEIYA